MIQARINGKNAEIESVSVRELILNQGLNPKSVVVEYNRIILKKEEWETTRIKQGDTLEILNFVGGG